MRLRDPVGFRLYNYILHLVDSADAFFQSDLQAFIYTFTHWRLSQPRRATASSSGAELSCSGTPWHSGDRTSNFLPPEQLLQVWAGNCALMKIFSTVEYLYHFLFFYIHLIGRAAAPAGSVTYVLLTFSLSQVWSNTHLTKIPKKEQHESKYNTFKGAVLDPRPSSAISERPEWSVFWTPLICCLFRCSAASERLSI